MEKTKQIKNILIVTLAIFLFGFFITPKETNAQVFVPVHDSITNASLSGLLTVSNINTLQTAIATGALTNKEVGPVPGINPVGNVGTQIATAPGSANFWATQISRTLIQFMTQSIVNWINSGFEGQPSFVRDPGEFLLDVGDVVAGDFIEGSDLDFLCSPFQLDIRALLNIRYTDSGFNVSCRLTDVLQNIDNFTDFTRNGNFAAAGWSGWFSTAHPNGNIYGSTLEAEAELGVRIRGRRNIELLQLEWGSGFLSFQKCEEPAGAPLDECLVKGPVKTPGVVIEDGLAETLGGEFRQLELADSVDKILNALLNYFITQALSETGLLP